MSNMCVPGRHIYTLRSRIIWRKKGHFWGQQGVIPINRLAGGRGVGQQVKRIGDEKWSRVGHLEYLCRKRAKNIDL